MDLELVTIGTELLLGFTVDTNGAEIGRALAAAGVRVVRRTSVGDDGDTVAAAVREALARTGAVLCTGGLGPTRDDVTKRSVAALFGRPLRFDDAIWAELEARLARLGRRPAAANRCQAEVPEGAVVLPNRWGTAPGLWLEGEPGLVVLLPGVPREMRGLLEHEVLPRLTRRGDASATIRSRQLRTTGIAESSLAELVAGAEEALAPLTLAYLPGVEGVDLRLTAWHLPADEADRRLGEGLAWLRARAGRHAYAEGDDDLALVVLERLRARGWSLGVAESCTGGMLGARLTAIAGSSDVFMGGTIAYANRVKEAALGVPPGALAAHGAVSEPVARAMAEGARARHGVDCALAITGIAGPGGGTAEKPVGTIWLACATPEGTRAERIAVPGNRDEIRRRGAQAALYLLWRELGA